MSDDWELPESEIQQQIARAAIDRIHSKETAMAKEKGGVIGEINRKLRDSKKKGDMDVAVTSIAGVGVQQELIEDARQVKKLPAKLRNLLAPLCEAEELAGSNRLRATELLDQIRTHMAENDIPQVALPNGGKVIYSEEKKARYVAPKKKKIVVGDEDESEESDEE